MNKNEILKKLSAHYFGEHYLKDNNICFTEDDIIIKPDSDRLFLNLDNTDKFKLPFDYSGIDVFIYPLFCDGDVIEPLSHTLSYHLTWTPFAKAVEMHPDI
tara:strand:- start:44 stop:346 length:303 start_codon:yes stop_codon:yes gene_type:complete